MGVAGLTYISAPACANSRLAGWHFWLHSIGLPVMMLSLAYQDYGHPEIEPLTAISSMTVFLALLRFSINVVKNWRRSAN